MKPIQLFVGGFLSAVLIVSCTPLTDDCVCTAEFKTITVVIVDSDHQPIDSLNTVTSLKHSGLVMREDSSSARPMYLLPGEYIVLTDAEKDFFTTFQEPVLLTASNSRHGVVAEFAFSLDRCQCHVWKSAGPDSIVAP
ncbi:MAG: hypothetical protein OEV30_13445 [Ignavibacteria bacterium]|nr:hypothetical protein [Ignavibacteria bacterium]